MKRLARLLKHRWLDHADAKRALDDAALDRLAARVRSSELRHSGEIRVCVEAGLPLSYLWRDAPPRERALALFGKLGVWDTEHNNGVLIFLLLAEHAVEIIADRGLNQRVPPDTWRGLSEDMAAAFGAGRYEQGLGAAIDAVGSLLQQHFALAEGGRNPNELPDRPVLLTRS